eukprot:gene4369-6656_t
MHGMYASLSAQPSVSSSTTPMFQPQNQTCLDISTNHHPPHHQLRTHSDETTSVTTTIATTTTNRKHHLSTTHSPSTSLAAQPRHSPSPTPAPTPAVSQSLVCWLVGRSVGRSVGQEAGKRHTAASNSRQSAQLLPYVRDRGEMDHPLRNKNPSLTWTQDEVDRRVQTLQAVRASMEGLHILIKEISGDISTMTSNCKHLKVVCRSLIDKTESV